MRLVSPVDGTVLALSNVKDAVFAQGIMGQGAAVAVDVSKTIIEVMAPSDGLLSVVAETGHAFGMILDDGIEVLVHVGLDTVELNGEGFEILVGEGNKILSGTPVIRVNAEKIRAFGKDIITPIVICEPSAVVRIEVAIDARVRAGIDTIITYQLIKK